MSTIIGHIYTITATGMKKVPVDAKTQDAKQIKDWMEEIEQVIGITWQGIRDKQICIEHCKNSGVDKADMAELEAELNEIEEERKEYVRRNKVCEARLEELGE